MRPHAINPLHAAHPRRRVRALGALLLLIPLLTGMLGVPAATGDDLSSAIAQQKAIAARIAAQKKQVQALTARQRALSTKIASAAKTLNGINANLTDVKAQVDTLAANVHLVQASYQDLVNQVTQIDRQLKGLEDEEVRRQGALFQRKQLLAQRIRDAYATSQTSLLEVLLSSQSFTDALSQMGYYLDIGSQDEALAAQISQDVHDIDALHQAVMGVRAQTEDLQAQIGVQKTALDADLASLEKVQSKLTALQKKAQAQLASQKAAYEQLASNKTSLAAAIKRATAAKAALQKTIDRLVAEQRNQGSIPSQFSGTLRWPMSGTISQEFGCTGVISEPRVGNCAHFHEGIDIVAPYGTPVRAAGDGVVVYIGWNYADGYDPAWIVIIAHSSSLQTWYAHMQPLYPVHQGQHVSAGQVIGYEGNTGHSTGAHLHWAVMLNHTFVNPRLFL